MPNNSEVVGWPSGKQPINDSNMAALEQRAIDSVRHDGDEMTDTLTIVRSGGGTLLVVKNSGASGDVRAQVDNRDAGGFGLEILAGASGTQVRDIANSANRVLIDGSKFDFQTAVEKNGDPVAVRASGTYTGNSASATSQTISLTFTPVYVVVAVDDSSAIASSFAVMGWLLSDSATESHTFGKDGAHRATQSGLVAGGFEVFAQLNQDAVTYRYQAIG